MAANRETEAVTSSILQKNNDAAQGHGVACGEAEDGRAVANKHEGVLEGMGGPGDRRPQHTI